MNEERAHAFTEAWLKKLEPTEERQYFSDTEVRSLKYALYPSNERSFLVYRRVMGRPERMCFAKTRSGY